MQIVHFSGKTQGKCLFALFCGELSLQLTSDLKSKHNVPFCCVHMSFLPTPSHPPLPLFHLPFSTRKWSWVWNSECVCVCVCVASIQLQNYSRQLGMNKVRATVAPLPSSSATSSSSSLGPPPSKASRPALNFLSSSNSGSSRAPTRQEGNDDDDDDNSVLIQ